LNYAPVAAYLWPDVPHAIIYSLWKNSTQIQKIKRKYYNIFTILTQENFKPMFLFLYVSFFLHKLYIFFYNHLN